MGEVIPFDPRERESERLKKRIQEKMGEWNKQMDDVYSVNRRTELLVGGECTTKEFKDDTHSWKLMQTVNAEDPSDCSALEVIIRDTQEKDAQTISARVFEEDSKYLISFMHSAIEDGEADFIQFDFATDPENEFHNRSDAFIDFFGTVVTESTNPERESIDDLWGKFVESITPPPPKPGNAVDADAGEEQELPRLKLVS